MSFKDTVSVAASGLHAQALRMRVIAENLANADSLSRTAGGDPYRRRVATFRSHVDRATGAMHARVRSIVGDRSAFARSYDPSNPAADTAGYVARPNVNALIEMADMKSAQRSYEANLRSIEAARSMTMRTIDLLR